MANYKLQAVVNPFTGDLDMVAVPFGAGITSLNGLLFAAQFLTTGTSGTNFGISSVGNTHTFNLPDASGTARGVITTGIQNIGGVKTFLSAPVFNLGAVIPTAQSLSLQEVTDTYSVNLRASNSLTANVTYEIPPAPAVNGYVLSSTTAGVMSWIAPSGGVTSVSNSDGTLTISPTTGAVIASRSAITGDVDIPLGSNVSALANSGVTAGSYVVTGATIDAKGRVTSAQDNFYLTIVNAIIFG